MDSSGIQIVSKPPGATLEYSNNLLREHLGILSINLLHFGLLAISKKFHFLITFDL